MSYRPIDRNADGIVFFGDSATDAMLQSVSGFTYDDGSSTLTVPNIIISDGANIGSASDTDALSIASNGNVTISQSLSITGNLTVNGTTTTVNSTTVTIDDPIFTLGGDTAPGSDDDKDRGIEFRWHNGAAAKVGFFGFDDSTGKFTFIPDATNASEVFSGTAGTIVANLEGNVTGNLTGTADDADGLSSAVTVSLGGELSGSSTFQNAGDTCSITAYLGVTSITGKTELAEAPDATNDYILIYDSSATALKKINRSNFVSGLGAMSSFSITDGTTTETIGDSNTITFADGTGIDVVVSATDTVTIGIADDGVDSAQIAAGAIDLEHMSANSVDSDQYVDGSIDTAHISAGAVTEDKVTRSVDSSFTTGDTISSDINLVAGGAGGITVNLPSPASGKMVIVKKTDSAAGVVTVSRNSTESIDGASSVVLYAQYESMTFVSDGTNWFVV